jgi:hypothetical protein
MKFRFSCDRIRLIKALPNTTEHEKNNSVLCLHLSGRGPRHIHHFRPQLHSLIIFSSTRNPATNLLYKKLLEMFSQSYIHLLFIAAALATAEGASFVPASQTVSMMSSRRGSCYRDCMNSTGRAGYCERRCNRRGR